MKVVAIVGAAVIALAIIGLAIDVERGAPRQRDLVPVPATLDVQTHQDEVAISEGPSPGCIPSCTTVEYHLRMRIDGMPALPDLGVSARLADGTIVPLTWDEGVWAGMAELDGDRRGQAMAFLIGDAPFLDWTLGSSGASAAPLVPGAGNVTLEQIGAVEISALIDARIDATPPTGTQLLAWLGDTAIPVVDGAIDERIERLSIEQRFIVTLEPVGPPPAAPGLIVFQAVPIA